MVELHHDISGLLRSVTLSRPRKWLERGVERSPINTLVHKAIINATYPRRKELHEDSFSFRDGVIVFRGQTRHVKGADRGSEEGKASESHGQQSTSRLWIL